jgi:hypothetical protein
MEKQIIVPEGTKILTLLEGKALTPREKRQLHINGSINSISRFLKIREGNPLTDHVIFSRKDMEIKYYKDDNNELFDSIAAKLELNPDLKELDINVNSNKSPKTLAQFLKNNRIFFEDKDVNMSIVSALNKFSGKITGDIIQEQDDRGNEKKLAEVKTESNIPEHFTLRMPIFVGQPVKTFRVEIFIHITDGGIMCVLDSPELRDIIITERDRVLDEEIKSILAINPDYVIIEK